MLLEYISSSGIEELIYFYHYLVPYVLVLYQSLGVVKLSVAYVSNYILADFHEDDTLLHKFSYWTVAVKIAKSCRYERATGFGGCNVGGEGEFRGGS